MNYGFRIARRRAMTLIELIAAVTLSTLLMIALIGVLKGLHLQESRAAEIVHRKWPARLLQILHRDLMAADSVWVVNGKLSVNGQLPTYNRSATPSVRSVRYEIWSLGSNTALARNDSGFRELLAIGPKELRVERIDQHGATQPLPSRPGPVPRGVRVWVRVRGKMKNIGDIPLQAGAH